MFTLYLAHTKTSLKKKREIGINRKEIDTDRNNKTDLFSMKERERDRERQRVRHTLYLAQTRTSLKRKRCLSFLAPSVKKKTS